ncbi:MAG: tRNA (adenosine(37)-N6)-threonylcarbamoyltransferase complex dimerization subunit type 1 TsaB, partial [Acidobacteriota bacterium]
MILAIETSLRSASISVYNNNRELGFYIFGEDEPISQNLVPGIKTLFKDVGISSQEITSVAVSNGPGSLTGIRVGISVGLGLAYSWG